MSKINVFALFLICIYQGLAFSQEKGQESVEYWIQQLKSDDIAIKLKAIEEMGKQGITMVYTKLHRVVGEGNFVLTQSGGSFAGQPYAFYDLFRLENGKIAEHWDVMQPIPAELPHSNAMF